MEQIEQYLDNYSRLWRQHLIKFQYCKEFGYLSDEEIIIHNINAKKNNELMTKINFKINYSKFSKKSLDEYYISTILKLLNEYSEKNFIHIIV